MKQLTFTLFLSLFLFAGSSFTHGVHAQGGLSLSLPDTLQPLFLAGLSPVVLPKEGIEISSYNALTSFWLAVRELRPGGPEVPVTNRYRFTALDHFVRVSYGFSRNQRWDLGAEFRYSHRRTDDEATSSPLRIFEGANATSTTTRGLALAGVRMRYQPFRNLSALTLQGGLTFPMGGNEEERLRLGADRIHLDLAATFYEGLTERTYYFLQGGWLLQLKGEENDRTTHVPSISGFLVRSFLYHRVYVYPGLTYVTSLQSTSKGGFRQINQQLLGGIGVQYQPVTGFNVSLYGQVPFILESGNTTVEWVRESYSSVTLGLLVRI